MKTTKNVIALKYFKNYNKIESISAKKKMLTTKTNISK